MLAFRVAQVGLGPVLDEVLDEGDLSRLDGCDEGRLSIWLAALILI